MGGVDLIAEQMPQRTTRYWVETKKRCTDLHLTIVSLSPSNNFGRTRPAERQVEVENVKRWIDAAFVLGAPCVRIFAGWPPAGQARVFWPKMVQCMRAVATHAAQAGITLVVEPHNHGGFVSNVRSALRLLRQVDTPWIKLNLDTGGYIEKSPEALYAAFETSLPYAPHVVAKMHDVHPAKEPLDYDRIVAMLARRGYHGFVTVEYEGEADEMTAVPKAVALLRQYARTHAL